MKKKQLYDMYNEPGNAKEKSFGRYWNKEHRKYNDYRTRFPEIMQHVKGPKLLDIGCGTGLVCYLASQRDDIIEVHGLDVQKSVLEEARINVPDVVFLNGFAEELPFQDEYFNTVVMTEVIEHVFDVDQSISEVARILKPAGRIVMTCPYKGRLTDKHIRTINRQFIKESLSEKFNIKKINIRDDFNRFKAIFCVGEKI